jgi:electron transfer flavoprotein alpha subunit
VSTVLVVDEAGNGAPRKSTFELLTFARRLGEPAAVVHGEVDDTALDAFGRFGATTVFAVEPADGAYPPSTMAQAVVALVAKLAPAAVLVTSSAAGKQVAARVAVRTGAGIVTDAVDVQSTPDGVIATQQVFAGAWMVTSLVGGGTPVLTVRPNAVVAEPAPEASTPTTERVEVEPEAVPAPRVLSRTARTASGRPDLADAAIVVAGGRGVGSAEGFDLVGRLADALGGAVGASRAATDLAWCPHELQVGQTGKTVSPQLYLASGISGAIQHRAGMQGSRTVVAINKDAKAPIFEIADFGVVGDLHSVLPALIDEIGKRSGRS